jgi:hypothetical protein
MKEEKMKHDDPFKESMRYIDNARQQLKQAGKEDYYFIDEKYVKTACGTAYSGALKAIDFLFDIRNIQKQRGRKSIEYYRTVLGGMDKKLLKILNSAYTTLHLSGYYEGETNVKIIEAGLDSAILIINALKPYSKNGQE